VESFIQNFDSDVGFTYDNSKAEFVGGLLRQKIQRPASATCGATYSISVNFNWGDGVLVGTAVGGAGISGGKLDLTGGGVRYVQYNPAGNYNNSGIGCLRVKFTPNYSGSPVSSQNIVDIGNGIDSTNRFIFGHATSGNMFFNIFNGLATIFVSSIFGVWSPTIGVEYELEINWDVISGATRLFIDGIQFGATKTETGTCPMIGLTQFLVGTDNMKSNQANCKIDNFVMFTSVQHIANYIPGYNLPENDYAENVVVLPEFHYVGSEEIGKYLDLIVTEVDVPHYIVDGQYWNGALWVASDNSYTQSNIKVDIVANLSTKIVNDNPVLKIIFRDGNTRGSVDTLVFDYGLHLSMIGELISLSEFLGLLNKYIAFAGDILTTSEMVAVINKYIKLSGNSETLSKIESTLLIQLYYKQIIAELK